MRPAILVVLVLLLVGIEPALAHHLGPTNNPSTLADGSAALGNLVAGSLGDLDLADGTTLDFEEVDVGTGIGATNETYIDPFAVTSTRGTVNAPGEAASATSGVASLIEADYGTPGNSGQERAQQLQETIGTVSSFSALSQGTGPATLNEGSNVIAGIQDTVYTHEFDNTTGEVRNFSLMTQQTGSAELVEEFMTPPTVVSDYVDNYTDLAGTTAYFPYAQADDIYYATLTEGNYNGTVEANATNFYNDPFYNYGTSTGKLEDVHIAREGAHLNLTEDSGIAFRLGFIFLVEGLTANTDKLLHIRARNVGALQDSVIINWAENATTPSWQTGFTISSSSWTDYYLNLSSGARGATSILVRFRDANTNTRLDEIQVDRLYVSEVTNISNKLDVQMAVNVTGGLSPDLEFRYYIPSGGDDFIMDVMRAGAWYQKMNLTKVGIFNAYESVSLSPGEIINGTVNLRFRDNETKSGPDSSQSYFDLFFLRVNQTTAATNAGMEIQFNFTGINSGHPQHEIQALVTVPASESFDVDIYNFSANGWEMVGLLSGFGQSSNVWALNGTDHFNSGQARVRVMTPSSSGDTVESVLLVNYLRIVSTTPSVFNWRHTSIMNITSLPTNADGATLSLTYNISNEWLVFEVWGQNTWSLLDTLTSSSSSTRTWDAETLRGDRDFIRLRFSGYDESGDQQESSWTIDDLAVDWWIDPRPNYTFEAQFIVDSIPAHVVQTLQWRAASPGESFGLEIWRTSPMGWDPVANLNSGSFVIGEQLLPSDAIPGGILTLRIRSQDDVLDGSQSVLELDYLRVFGSSPAIDHRLRQQIDIPAVAPAQELQLQIVASGTGEAFDVWAWNLGWDSVGTVQAGTTTTIQMDLPTTWITTANIVHLSFTDASPGDPDASVLSLDQIRIFYNDAPETPDNLVPAPSTRTIHPPSFSWDFVDTNGDAQGQMEIDVASAPSGFVGGDGDDGDVWNPTAGTGTSIDYGGPALAPGSTYWWRVRVSDVHDTWSPWTAASSFVMEEAPAGVLRLTRDAQPAQLSHIGPGLLTFHLDVDPPLDTVPTIAIATPGSGGLGATAMQRVGQEWIHQWTVEGHDDEVWVDGVNTITIANAFDAGGTEMSLTGPSEFVTDTRAPTVEVFHGGEDLMENVTVTGTAADLGNVTEVYLQVQGQTFEAADINTDGTAWSSWIVQFDSNLIDDGSHVLFFWAVDEAGNADPVPLNVVVANSGEETPPEEEQDQEPSSSSLTPLLAAIGGTVLLILALLILVSTRKKKEPLLPPGPARRTPPPSRRRTPPPGGRAGIASYDADPYAKSSYQSDDPYADGVYGAMTGQITSLPEMTRLDNSPADFTALPEMDDKPDVATATALLGKSLAKAVPVKPKPAPEPVKVKSAPTPVEAKPAPAMPPPAPVAKSAAPFKLEVAHAYLFREDATLDSDATFARFLKAGKKGFAISREAPGKLAQRLGVGADQFEGYWLTQQEGETNLDPRDMEGVSHQVKRFLRENENGVLMIQGLEYLSTYNKFRHCLKLIQDIRDYIAVHDAVLLVSISPETLDKKDLKSLERECEVVPADSTVEI